MRGSVDWKTVTAVAIGVAVEELVVSGAGGCGLPVSALQVTTGGCGGG